MVGSDGATLGSLVENDLTYGHSSGKLEDRAAFLKALNAAL